MMPLRLSQRVSSMISKMMRGLACQSGVKLDQNMAQIIATNIADSLEEQLYVLPGGLLFSGTGIENVF